MYNSTFTEQDVDRHFLVTETRDHSVIVFQEQYRTLRQEILQRQQRRFLIVLGGSIGVPGLTGLSVSDTMLGDLVFVIPIIVVVVSYLFIIENSSIARAGDFIQHSIEDYFKKIPGWEHYLKDNNRVNENIKNAHASDGAQGAFILLLIVYFISAFVLASKKIFEYFPNYGGVLWCVFGLFYGILFVHWLWNTRSALDYSAQRQKKLS